MCVRWQRLYRCVCVCNASDGIAEHVCAMAAMVSLCMCVQWQRWYRCIGVCNDRDHIAATEGYNDSDRIAVHVCVQWKRSNRCIGVCCVQLQWSYRCVGATAIVSLHHCRCGSDYIAVWLHACVQPFYIVHLSQHSHSSLRFVLLSPATVSSQWLQTLRLRIVFFVCYRYVIFSAIASLALQRSNRWCCRYQISILARVVNFQRTPR